ncbi:MAG: cell division protein ZapA [Pseudomonadota bacterium]
MPNVSVAIGGKSFTVACRDGEEDYLLTAAAMLDREAVALVDQIGRLDETRMLLMAGLMLADRTAAFEERAKAAESKLAAQETAPVPQGNAVSPAVFDTLLSLAMQAEGLADRAEAKMREGAAPTG